jgi:16S rRNA (cytidine1402-2'-O)-methyltransferase
MEDITLRAIRVLKECDLIAAEDTRRTGLLLHNYGIKKEMTSFNEFTARQKVPHLIALLEQGKNVALVSDNGTPGISDPGYLLIKACADSNIPIVPVPGPSAAISALVCSGFPTDCFVFYGFVPKKEGQKKKFFEAIEKDMSVVVYESPHRLIKTLKLIAELMPERKICIAREMTKKFEEFVRGSAAAVYEKLNGKNIKGEICIVLSKQP